MADASASAPPAVPEDLAVAKGRWEGDAVAASNAQYRHTNFRVRDAEASTRFYCDHFGMRVVHRLDFPQWKFDLTWLASIPEGTALPEPGTPEAGAFVDGFRGTILAFTHNYGTEKEAKTPYVNGNDQEKRGFGHTGFTIPRGTLAKFCEDLEANGVRFKKRPHEGRMKSIAFALDPDDYYVEILEGGEEQTGPVFQQTMLRVSDPEGAIRLFVEGLGMSLVRRLHFPAAKFSLYFLAHVAPGVELPDPDSPEAGPICNELRGLNSTLVELTHNWDDETYTNGNEDPYRGFANIGFAVDDIEAQCEAMEAAGAIFKKKPKDGNMHTIAFAVTPGERYAVELVQRGSG